jgi:hypothetical protein
MTVKFINYIKKTTGKLIFRINQTCAGRLVFTIIEWLTGYRIEKRRFFKKNGYYPDLKNPKSFNEKVLYKKIYDRNPLLPVTTDKYLVREYLKNILGKKEAEKILIPLYFVTDKPGMIPFDYLEKEYVIKPNHDSGKIILAENSGSRKKFTIMEGNRTISLIDCVDSRNQIKRTCENWLSMVHGFYFHEWAYQKIKRKILIEKLLRSNDGKMAEDYKFHIFNGKCHWVLVVSDRFANKKLARYTPDWEYLYYNIENDTELADRKNKPENFDYMLNLAELLGKPFDYIRVDLYSLDNDVYFGELTSYPQSGYAPFFPASLDFTIGAEWKLTPKYWQ